MTYRLPCQTIKHLLKLPVIFFSSAKNVKVTLGVEQTVAKYNNKIFAGWDFCVSGIQAAKLKKESVRKDIMVRLCLRLNNFQTEY